MYLIVKLLLNLLGPLYSIEYKHIVLPFYNPKFIELQNKSSEEMNE